MRKWILAVVGSLVALCLLTTLALATLVAMDPTVVIVEEGETGVISIMIENVSKLGYARVNLTFNESVVNVTAISDSDFLDSRPDNYTRGPGWVLLEGAQFVKGLEGIVRLCNLTLYAIGEREDMSMLNLTDVALDDMQMKPIKVDDIINGSFTIGDTHLSLTSEPMSKEVNQSENANYTLTVTNHENASNTILLNITLNEAAFGSLSKDTFTLNASESNISYLTVKDPNVGIFNTSVRATLQGNSSVFAEVRVVTTVIDLTPPAVTNASAEPKIIPKDTDGVPLCGETSNLSVVVTDESNISSVTINLSAIGGSTVQPMRRIMDSNVWVVTTNASVGSAIFEGGYVPSLLEVNATDEHLNSNTAANVELVVVKSGDVHGTNGNVEFRSDALYLVRYTKKVPFYNTIQENVADVGKRDGVLDFRHDALYLVRHTRNVPGYEVLN